MLNHITPEDSKDFCESLVDNMLDGLAYWQMIFDEEGHPVDFVCLLVNKNFELLTGLPHAVAKNITELIPEVRTVNPELFEIFGRVASGGKPERFESYIAPLGRWFLISAYSHKKDFFVTIFQNITAHKQIDKELEIAHKAEYQNLVNNLSVGVYRNTPGDAGRFLEANPAMVAMFEAESKEEFLKHHVSDIYQDPAKRKLFVEKLMKYGSLKNEEINFVTLKGKPLTGSVTAVMKKAPEGSIYFDGICEDITERKRAEEASKRDQAALAAANASNEALLESMREGVIALDQDGNTLTMNRAAEELLGFTTKEIEGKFFAYILCFAKGEGGDQLSVEGRYLPWAFVSGQAPMDCYVVRKDGTKSPIAMTTAPLMVDDKPMGSIIVFRDMTKEKEIENLRIDFLALASHQLRTPLSGTKWLIETMQREVIGHLNAKQKKYMDNLYQINELMIKLVSDMLNVLILEGGALVIKTEGLSVRNICEELFSTMKLSAQNKNIVLRQMLPNDHDLFVRSNAQALQTILENLLTNAIAYSPDGQEVVLSAKEEGTFILFSVSDHGIGIPKEEQKRIFERFYRASNAKKFRPGGTGLGLYGAFLLTRQLSGKIFFESEEDKGTTFYLQIPQKSTEGTLS